MEEICAVALTDEVTFRLLSLEPIRKNDPYGGYRVRLDAVYDTICAPLSIDISTGDVITPQAVRYSFRGMFDDDLRIQVWGYNIETVLAEKVETILRRGRLNTRPKDYYDVFILATTQPFDGATFANALYATAKHRESLKMLENTDDILLFIAESEELEKQWRGYQRAFPYAAGIPYDQVITVLTQLVHAALRSVH